MIKKISYVGLGTMGAGMASDLLKAGYQLAVWDRTAAKCAPFGMSLYGSSKAAITRQ